MCQWMLYTAVFFVCQMNIKWPEFLRGMLKKNVWWCTLETPRQCLVVLHPKRKLPSRRTLLKSDCLAWCASHICGPRAENQVLSFLPLILLPGRKPFLGWEEIWNTDSMTIFYAETQLSEGERICTFSFYFFLLHTRKTQAF